MGDRLREAQAISTDAKGNFAFNNLPRAASRCRREAELSHDDLRPKRPSIGPAGR
jgi:hypothetical protein